MLLVTVFTLTVAPDILCSYRLFCVFSCFVCYSFIFLASLQSAFHLFRKHKELNYRYITVPLSMHTQSAQMTARCQITHKNVEYSAAQSDSVIAGLPTNKNSSSSSRPADSYRRRLSIVEGCRRLRDDRQDGGRMEEGWKGGWVGGWMDGRIDI